MSTPASLPSRAAVVIVGGGMAGLSCAASLARRGVRGRALRGLRVWTRGVHCADGTGRAELGRVCNLVTTIHNPKSIPPPPERCMHGMPCSQCAQRSSDAV